MADTVERDDPPQIRCQFTTDGECASMSIVACLCPRTGFQPFPYITLSELRKNFEDLVHDELFRQVGDH